MDKTTKEVIYKPSARNSIRKIAKYIAENGYPETSKKFASKLYEFGDALAILPEKYQISRHEKFEKRKLRSVPYKDYIFIYKVVRSQLVIYNVIHGSSIH